MSDDKDRRRHGTLNGFDDTSELLLEPVRAGATIDEASRRVGVKVATARAWAARGRKEPEGCYGRFARDLDLIRSTRRLPASRVRRAMTRDEWEGCVATAVRSGSVAAMRLWHETHGVSVHKQQVVDSDAFEDLDNVEPIAGVRSHGR